MRKQLIILFAVLLAVFLAIGCTSDTQDQPTENQTSTDQPTTEEGMEEDVTGAEEDVEEDVTGVEEDLTEDEEMVENDTMEDEEMMDNGTMEGEEFPVAITQDGFEPFDVQITVGDTVTWTNDDSRTHTVTDDEGVFDSGELQAGETYSYTFEEAGTYTYGSETDSSFEAMITVVTSTEGTTDTGEENTSGDVVVVPAS